VTRKYYSLTIIAMVLLFSLLVGCSSTPSELTPTPDTSIVWSEDFEDGDMEGWEIISPRDVFYVEEGVLMSGPQTGGDMQHESNVSTGTWSFDIYLPETMLGPDIIGLFVAQDDINAFGFEFRNILDKTRITALIVENTQFNYVSQIRVPKAQGWNHIDITRDEIGKSRVFLNQELVMEYEDDLTITPHSFHLGVNDVGPAFDNLVVRNQVIDIQHPTE
jgi:hypothetical protein